MYQNSQIFYPKSVYLDLDFNVIKENLKLIVPNYSDYGSIIVLKDDQYYYSVNDIGKVEVFYNELDNIQIEKSIKRIESIFRIFVDDFRIVH